MIGVQQQQQQQAKVSEVEDRRVFASGSVRSSDVDHLAFDLICPYALSRLAARYALGAEKYGRQNWTAGMPLLDVYNHVLSHLNKWRQGDLYDDNLAAAAWGIFALLHFESGCGCGDVQYVMDVRLDQYLCRNQGGGIMGVGPSQEGPSKCQTTPPLRRPQELNQL